MTLVVTLTVRRIVRPVKTLAEALNRFGDLDLTRDASHWWLQKQTGEIGEMTGALGRLQEALAHMMGVLQTESERCHGAAETLAGLSEESVASAEEIRAALSEASSLSQTGAAALDEARRAPPTWRRGGGCGPVRCGGCGGPLRAAPPSARRRRIGWRPPWGT